MLLAALLLAVVALAVYGWRSFPQRSGSLHIAGLQQPVLVERDAADLTHIRARTQHDAFLAMGYVHAQERGWQLAFNRRLMHGRLSEILGPATLETDKLLRTLGIARAAEQQLAGLPPEAQAALQAYSDGINAFFAHSGQILPPEFLLLRATPGAPGAAWAPADSVGWALMMALDLGGNWGNEFARLSAAQVLDTGRLWQLFPPYPGEKPAARADLAALYRGLGLYRNAGPSKTGAILPAAALASGPFDAEMAAWAADFAAGLGSSEGKGSNSWAVAGSHTTSGKPLLANDPHLALGAPALWYFAHLQAPAEQGAPALDVVGATLPGLPFVVLGRTPQVAWSFTNTGPDVQDLYIEQINPANPAQYRVPGAAGTPAWANFATRSETIQVKGAPDVVLTVRTTRHGPVLSDAQASHGTLLDLSRHVLALRWSALDADNHTVLAGMRSNYARSVQDLLAANADYAAPMQNLVAADTTGRIAFKAVGRVPLRRADNDIQGVAPSPGWEPRYDWAGWLPYADTPQDDPAQTAATGWIATANQRITPRGYPHFLGQDWAVPYRQQRIETLLAATPRHSLASQQALQNDVLSPAAVRLLPHLRTTTGSHPLAAAAQRQLAGFDGHMAASSAGALIFSAWADELTRGLLIPKLGAERFTALYGKRNFRQTLEWVLEQDDAWWCAPLGCAAQSAAALDRALSRLQAAHGSDPATWQWGAAHPALSVHRPFGTVPALAALFDVRVPSGGDAYTVNVGQYWANDAKAPFASRHAASLRAIYDLADPEQSLFIYQTGQSGLVFSPRYRDMADAWASGRYRPLQMAPADIHHRLTLLP